MPEDILEQKIEMLRDEDLDSEIERQIERQSKENPPELYLDGANQNVVKVDKEHKELLREYFEDYRPASTINELEDQVWQAKNHGCDSIEATDQIIRHYCKGTKFPDRTGYFIYKDIKVYIDGWAEKSKAQEKMTMEEKLFPKKA